MNAPVEAGIAPFVLSRTDGDVCHLTLNRGASYNPLSRDMIAALQAELTRVAADGSARCVVLGANGKGFCAGHDLKELRAHNDLAWQRELFAACNALMLSITQIPQPVIARVHGIATAAGCQLVSMCDLAVASETARFALPGVNVGVFCTTPAVGVGRNIGRKRVMEMLLTGEPVDAATALAWGLVNRVVPEAELDGAVSSLVKLITARSRAVIAGGKQAFYRQMDLGLEPAYGLAAEAMACSLLEPGAHEGIDAFVGKRPPRWPD
ncbi:MAG TPA: enoyl-CoA hydratase [Casimicrobiaceae bacterium]|nr:enoyl-CoA hydratase [Casimicrobiaceae bacterium]